MPATGAPTAPSAGQSIPLPVLPAQGVFSCQLCPVSVFVRFDGGDQPTAAGGWFDAVLAITGLACVRARRWPRVVIQAVRAVVRQMAPELILGLAVLVLATVQLVYRLQGRELGVWSGALQLGFMCW